MIKLLAVDIDGTLLNSKRIITDKTKEALKYATNKGVHVVLSTGRPVQGIYDIYDQLNLDTPAITYNGAIVIAHKKGPIIYECSLLPEDTKAIIDQGNLLDTTIAIWYQSKLYTNKLNDLAYEYATISNVPPILYENLNEIYENGATKVLYYDTNDTIASFQKSLIGVFSKNVVFHTSRPYFLEFVNKQVSKAFALTKLEKHFGISSNQIMAIGDGFNDLDMLKYSGIGVAMGNAPKEIKDQADYVTSDCDNDGIAKAIYKYI